MIIMLNGSFGVGKSSVATALLERLPNSMLYDPEEVGFMVRKVTAGILPDDENTDDFQDIAVWRTLVVATAEQLQRQYQRTMIVPMTLANLAYFAQIKAGFAQIGVPLHHFCLVAPLDVIYQRLLARGEREGGWCWKKATQYVPLFDDAAFAEHIDTSAMSVPEVVHHIVESIADSA